MRRLLLLAFVSFTTLLSTANAFAGNMFGGSTQPTCATCTAETCGEPCGTECNDRCFLGSLIAKFDATYEDALVRRHNKRPMCNRTMVPEVPAYNGCPSCAPMYGFPGNSTASITARQGIPARFLPPAPVADLEAGPHALASRAVSRPVGRPVSHPVSAPLAPHPQETAEEPIDAAPVVKKSTEPLELSAPQDNAGAKLLPARPARQAVATVEQAEYSTTTEINVAAPIDTALDATRAAIQASFSEVPPTAAAYVTPAPAAVPAAPKTVRPAEPRTPTLEVRIKSDLDELRPTTANPLR